MNDEDRRRRRPSLLLSLGGEKVSEQTSYSTFSFVTAAIANLFPRDDLFVFVFVEKPFFPFLVRHARAFHFDDFLVFVLNRSKRFAHAVFLQLFARDNPEILLRIFEIFRVAVFFELSQLRFGEPSALVRAASRDSEK